MRNNCTGNNFDTGRMTSVDHVGKLLLISSFRRQYVRHWLVIGPPLRPRDMFTRRANCPIKVRTQIYLKELRERVTLNKAVPGRTQKLCTFGGDAVPRPFKHLNNDSYISIAGNKRGSVYRASIYKYLLLTPPGARGDSSIRKPCTQNTHAENATSLRICNKIIQNLEE